MVLQVFTTANPSLNRPVGVAIDADGAIYIGDSGNNRVVKLATNGVQLEVLTMSNPSLSGPPGADSAGIGLAVDGSGVLYVADEYNARIVIYYFQLCPLGYYCPGLIPTAVLCPAGYYCPSQYLYAPNVIPCPCSALCPSGTSNLLSRSPASSQGIQIWTTTNPSLNQPTGVTLDGSQNVYVSDWNTRVVKFSPDGTTIQVLTTTNPSLNGPRGLAVDSSSNVYVADIYNNRVVKFASNGTLIAVWTASNPSLNSPSGVTFDTSNNAYVTEYFGNRIRTQWHCGSNLNHDQPVSKLSNGSRTRLKF